MNIYELYTCDFEYMSIPFPQNWVRSWGYPSNTVEKACSHGPWSITKLWCCWNRTRTQAFSVLDNFMIPWWEYIYIYYIYNITTDCNFAPSEFDRRGHANCKRGPHQRQKPKPKVFTFREGGEIKIKARKRPVTPYPPPNPPEPTPFGQYGRGWGREVTIVKCLTNCPKTVSKKFADVCNQPTPKVHISLQKQLKVDDKIKINPCNHRTSKALIHFEIWWGTFEVHLRYIWDIFEII